MVRIVINKILRFPLRTLTAEEKREMYPEKLAGAAAVAAAGVGAGG